jgi:hypothetical protein
MRNSFTIPLLAAISLAAAALLSDFIPSLSVSMTLVSVGIAGICTLILLFSLVEARKQKRLGATLVSTAVMAVITIVLIVWLLPRVQIEQPIAPQEKTPTGFPSA